MKRGMTTESNSPVECMFLCGRQATVKVGKIAMCDRCERAKGPSKAQLKKMIKRMLNFEAGKTL